MKKLFIVMILAMSVAILHGQDKKPVPAPKTATVAQEKSETCDCDRWPWRPSCNNVCRRIKGRISSIKDSNVTLTTSDATYSIKLSEEIKAAADVSTGQFVQVLYRKQDGERIATQVAPMGLAGNKKGQAKSGKK